jgi:hypothetical protein
MVTLSVYFEYINVKYLLNILLPYYKFIQAILLYFLKLLQMTLSIIIIIILFIFIDEFIIKMNLSYYL